MSEAASEPRVGLVTHFFGRIRVATVRLTAPVAVGDRLHVKGRSDDFTMRVKSMEIDHRPVERAEPGQVVGIKMPSKAHEGDVVMKAAPGSGRWGWLSRLLGS